FLDPWRLGARLVRAQRFVGPAHEFAVFSFVESVGTRHQGLVRVIAEDEAHTRFIPASEVTRLREVRVAAEQNVLPSGTMAELDRTREVLWRTLVGGAISRAIDDEERLACVRQRDYQRMVTPDAVVRQVHALLALAGGRNECAVRVDARSALEKRGCLLFPDLDTNVVDDIHQELRVIGLEPPTEVARSRRIRDTPGAERIEKCDVVATQLDVIEHVPATHHIIRDVEDVVRFAVRAPPLEDL